MLTYRGHCFIKGLTLEVVVLHVPDMKPDA